MADDKITGFLSKDTAGLPNWAWILVVGAGIAAVYVFPKFFPGAKSSSSPSSTGATDTSGLGLAVDPTTGLPYAVEGLVPSGGLPSTGGTGGTGGTTYLPTGQPVFPTGTVRSAATSQSSPTYGADLAESGIPILSQPNVSGFPNNELGLAAYGSQLQITGPAVQGSYNFANNAPGGSTLWYPVQYRGQNGYISAYDLAASGTQNVTTNAATWPGTK